LVQLLLFIDGNGGKDLTGFIDDYAALLGFVVFGYGYNRFLARNIKFDTFAESSPAHEEKAVDKNICSFFSTKILQKVIDKNKK